MTFVKIIALVSQIGGCLMGLGGIFPPKVDAILVMVGTILHNLAGAVESSSSK